MMTDLPGPQTRIKTDKYKSQSIIQMIADFIHSASSSHHLNLGSLELNESLMRRAVVAFAYLVNAHHDGNKLPVTKNVALILR